MATKNKFSGIDVAFIKEQLLAMRKFLDEHPYDTYKDRTEMKTTKAGGIMPLVVATIESQQKNHRDTVKDISAMYEYILNLQLKEDKVNLRKGSENEGSILG